MMRMKIIAIACCILQGAATSAYSASAPAGETADAKSAAPAAPAAVCAEAIVNPISGYAECVRPRGAPVDPPPPRPRVAKLAVFDFELEDDSPAASFVGSITSDAATMEKVSSEARRTLAESARFILVDLGNVDAEPVRTRSLRNCDGCEAGIALQADAEQALIGVVKKVTQTDYYVFIQIRDAQSGKVLEQEQANFAGGPEGWASAVRTLLKHQVLVPAAEP